jgi:uncharacterized protein YukE
MTTPDIQVDFARMEAAAQVLSSQASTLQGYVYDLGQSLQPLYQTWGTSGSAAAEAMQQEESKLTAATDDIITTIMQFSAAITSAQLLQVALENQNINLFQ